MALEAGLGQYRTQLEKGGKVQFLGNCVFAVQLYLVPDTRLLVLY